MSAAITIRPSPPLIVSRHPVRPRTLVVDDSPTILHAICSLLEHREMIDLVGRAGSGPETIQAVGDLKPDLVLMDADMPGMSGLRTSLLLTQSSPATRIVLMSMDTTAQFRRTCSGCGAFAVIYKPKFLSELNTLLHSQSAVGWGRQGTASRRKLRT
jgi:DNA-binding NarL/FixJ family response regulator